MHQALKCPAQDEKIPSPSKPRLCLTIIPSKHGFDFGGEGRRGMGNFRKLLFFILLFSPDAQFTFLTASFDGRGKNGEIKTAKNYRQIAAAVRQST